MKESSKKRFFWRFVLLFCIVGCRLSADGGLYALDVEKNFGIDVGYRVDQVAFNIAGNLNGSAPNVLSELTWSNLHLYCVEGKAKAVFNKKFYWRGFAGYGRSFGGDNQDSDYLGDNRTYEFSRSNNNGKIDNVLDFSSGLGYQFRSRSEKFKMAPLAGISYHEQNLRIMDGVQTVPASGAFGGLDATYKPR